MDKITTNIELKGNEQILNTPFGKTLSLDDNGIKNKRAVRYLTELESAVRKRVLDAKNALNSLLLQREEALDVLRKSADDLTVGKNGLNVNETVSLDERLTLDIYKANVKFELLKERYETLFGEFK